MIITEARNSDFPYLRTLFLNERIATFSWLDTAKFKLEDFDKETQGELILIVILDEKPVGFISIWIPNNFIHHLYIQQQYQNTGLATALLKTAIEKTKLPIRLKCLVKNTKAVNFYRRKGFIEKSKGQSPNGEYILFELTKNTLL
ncbi:GNAT family N-acetyltransferase [Flavobacterium foetidum]|uniref:GNAT family N-acetyltransferase n=1 Tax=Flavobacterium foetidum TaxID=2026681 RepID=UPI0010757BAF|nr:GNAT family N-acetyltransferase [Flavobacterium foetidum]KAF2517017.1 GNAT family N-acetyltransferase [Flavobacterium foetidum]